MVGGLVDERIDLNVHCLQALRSLASPRQPVSPASAVWLHQAVDFHIIGCGIPNTEIELLLAMAEVGGIPLFPTTRLHVDAAVDVALESRPTRGLSVRDRCQG